MENLYKQLILIQSALRAPKNQFNKFGGYTYRSCEDILEAVKPYLVQTNLVLLITDEVVQVGERYYIKATAVLSDGEKQIATSAMAREEESKKGCDASQITGAASSYARKYALNGLFCIDDNKDADTQAPADKAPKKAKAAEVYKCSECGKVFEGCTAEQYEKVKAASPDGVARCKTCRDKLSRELDEQIIKEDEKHAE